MRLITGGAYQGKLRYALEMMSGEAKDAANFETEAITDGAACEWNDLLTKPLVNHFHLWIKRMLDEGKDATALTEQIIQQNPQIVIVVNELGCGVVPTDALDRRYRETVGRICCKLAAEAEEVHRVICGIGTVIKHA